MGIAALFVFDNDKRILRLFVLLIIVRFWASLVYQCLHLFRTRFPFLESQLQVSMVGSSKQQRAPILLGAKWMLSSLLNALQVLNGTTLQARRRPLVLCPLGYHKLPNSSSDPRLMVSFRINRAYGLGDKKTRGKFPLGHITLSCTVPYHPTP